ncbi:hypothetical protein PsorP6_017593 [Peronosclerospora sorghi]|uniref:Uncharacterized protein n=1 Tax=Peronosclerospora sorghi TaxID=230839 RepID=A0ACC0WKU3_9STRA|nr:hypothetical protein PsorP6_017593 [Peronosclerospora sorghi]
MRSSSRCIHTFEPPHWDDDEASHAFPPLLHLLAHATLELIVTKKHTDVRYVMVVHQTDVNVMWHLSRSFDEYRKLQHRLLKQLHHGHFCNAECPWLYGFLKSYFPTKLFAPFSTSARVMAQRKEQLEHFFAALYGFLMHKRNVTCEILRTSVARELVDFLYANALDHYQLHDALERSPALESPLKVQVRERPGDAPAPPQRESFLTNSFQSSHPDETLVQDVHTDTCGICNASLSRDAFGSLTSTCCSSMLTASPSGTDAAGSMLGRSSSTESHHASTRLSSSGRGQIPTPAPRRRRRRRAPPYYVTTLTCGHQFHDECIVPKLNESLACPTCGRVQTNA